MARVRIKYLRDEKKGTAWKTRWCRKTNNIGIGEKRKRESDGASFVFNDYREKTDQKRGHD